MKNFYFHVFVFKIILFATNTNFCAYASEGLEYQCEKGYVHCKSVNLLERVYTPKRYWAENIKLKYIQCQKDDETTELMAVFPWTAVEIIKYGKRNLLDNQLPKMLRFNSAADELISYVAALQYDKQVGICVSKKYQKGSYHHVKLASLNFIPSTVGDAYQEEKYNHYPLANAQDIIHEWEDYFKQPTIFPELKEVSEIIPAEERLGMALRQLTSQVEKTSQQVLALQDLGERQVQTAQNIMNEQITAYEKKTGIKLAELHTEISKKHQELSTILDTQDSDVQQTLGDIRQNVQQVSATANQFQRQIQNIISNIRVDTNREDVIRMIEELSTKGESLEETIKQISDDLITTQSTMDQTEQELREQIGQLAGQIQNMKQKKGLMGRIFQKIRGR